MRKSERHHFVTIKDLAKCLNISVATVSRALRDTYDVSQETKNRVLEMAEKMNYKPNYNAIGLSQQRSHNIGVILPFITNYYFSTVITGIQEMAFSKEYNIVLYVTNDSSERELLITQNLCCSNLDGLLVCMCSDSESSEHFEEIRNMGIPVVFFDRVPKGIKTSKVVQDDFRGAFEAVEHLIERKYNKIAHITGPKGFILTERRLAGYLAALKKHHLPVRENWIIHSSFSQKSGELDTLNLLESDEKPNAIFAVNDRKAIGAILTLKQNKINVGKEVGIIGFTNDPMASIVSPSLSTIAEPAFEIGRKSCELLLKHIEKKNFIEEEISLECKLIVRNSTNPDQCSSVLFS